MPLNNGSPQETADWVNNVFQKTLWFHPLTCLCGEDLIAIASGTEAWLQCPNHQDFGTVYTQKIPEHVLKLKEIYPVEIPNPLDRFT